MRRNKVLSIVVTSHNQAESIGNMLRHLANVAPSCAGRFELIVVDDASDQEQVKKTRESVSDFIFDTCVSAYFIQNDAWMNAGGSRNHGAECSSGDWLWFVDGDDLLAPEALRSVVPALRDGADLIWVDEERVEDARVQGGRLGTQVGVADTRNFAKGDVSAMPTVSATTRSAFREVASSETPMLVMHQCVFRRTSIADVPFERFLVGEDILFATKALLKARGIVHVAAPLYGYVQRTSSVMNAARNCRRTSQSIAYMRELWGLYERERGRLHPRMVKQRHTQFFFALPSEILKFRGEERRRLFHEWRAATGCGIVGFLAHAMVFRMYRLVKGR